MNQITKSRRHPPEAVEVGVEAEMIWTVISTISSLRSQIMVADHIEKTGIMITTRESMSTVIMMTPVNVHESVNAKENTMITVIEIMIENVANVATETAIVTVIEMITGIEVMIVGIEIGIMMTDHEIDPEEEIVRVPTLT